MVQQVPGGFDAILRCIYFFEQREMGEDRGKNSIDSEGKERKGKLVSLMCYSSGGNKKAWTSWWGSFAHAL